MNIIFPSEKRKFLIGEIINLDSPTLIITHKSLSDIISSSPVKVITPSSLPLLYDKNFENFRCIILDPEFFYPLSPLFNNKYTPIYEFLKKNRFKDIITISASMPTKKLKNFLKDIGNKNQKIKVEPLPKFKANVIFTNNKVKSILKEINTTKDNKTIVVCKKLEHIYYLKLFLESSGINCFFIDNPEFDIRKSVLSKFKTKGGILIIPKKYKGFTRNVSTDKIYYLGIPYSIPEFIYDTTYIPSKEFIFFVSPKDESVLLSKMKKKKHLKDEFLKFLNFLGYKGNKTKYIQSYLLSRKISNIKHTSLEKISFEKLRISNSFRDKYLSHTEVIEILLGVGNYFLYKEFGYLRGKDRTKVEDVINELVNVGELGFKYFLSDGTLIKKVY